MQPFETRSALSPGSRFLSDCALAARMSARIARRSEGAGAQELKSFRDLPEDVYYHPVSSLKVVRGFASGARIPFMLPVWDKSPPGICGIGPHDYFYHHRTGPAPDMPSLLLILEACTSSCSNSTTTDPARHSTYDVAIAFLLIPYLSSCSKQAHSQSSVSYAAAGTSAIAASKLTDNRVSSNSLSLSSLTRRK